MPDNFAVFVRSQMEYKHHFTAALKLAFEEWGEGPDGIGPSTVKSYRIDTVPKTDRESYEGMFSLPEGHPRLVLFWTSAADSKDEEESECRILPLPHEMGTEAATSFAWHWLQSATIEVDRPDFDGSIGDGFIVSTGQSWGHAGEHSYGLVEIIRDWMWFHK